MEEKKLTGYPSIDKPWMKYYAEEATNSAVPECTMYEYIRDNNMNHPNDIPIRESFYTKLAQARFMKSVSWLYPMIFLAGFKKTFGNPYRCSR